MDASPASSAEAEISMNSGVSVQSKRGPDGALGIKPCEDRTIKCELADIGGGRLGWP